MATTRLKALLVAAGLATGAAGCAQCDTCDDFPAPCTGPNCGGAYGQGYAPAPAGHGGPTTAMPAPSGPASLAPAPDAAGPRPSVPPANPPAGQGGAADSSPPRAGEPGGRPGA